MKINTEDFVIVWNGSHTANVYMKGGLELDVFTFAFDRKPKATDFVSAAISYLEG